MKQTFTKESSMEVAASELMIGNLLYFKGTDMVATVQLINAPKHFDCRDEFGSFVPNGEYEAIPLTEDWLRRCGFISRSPETPHAIWDAPDNIKISMIVFLNPPERTEYRTGATTGGAKCNTVHQLQNLFFALTKQPLTIKQ